MSININNSIFILLNRLQSIYNNYYFLNIKTLIRTKVLCIIYLLRNTVFKVKYLTDFLKYTKKNY